jgi:hypothetical protein
MSEDPPQEGRARSTGATPHRISPQRAPRRCICGLSHLEFTMTVIPSAAEESLFASRPTARYNHEGG